MSLASTATGSSDLRAAVLRLDLRLRLAVDAQRTDLTERAKDPFRGLYISEADVDELLATTPAAEAARQLLASTAVTAAPRLGHLADLYRLDELEQEAL